jgi:hypothetical protein
MICPPPSDLLGQAEKFCAGLRPRVKMDHNASLSRERSDSLLRVASSRIGVAANVADPQVADVRAES